MSAAGYRHADAAMKAVRTVALIAALLGMAIGIRLFVDFRSEMRQQRARIATGSQVVQTQCGSIELVEAGKGPPLLAVHGTGGGFDQAMGMGADLVPRSLRVIAPSRFGYLRTDYPRDASAEAQADQFACLLDELGIARTAIMGVSAGANSAMQFAIRHPQRTSALILLVPAAYQPSRAQPSPQKLAALREWALMRIVSSDFLFWLVNRYARETAVQMVLATPIEDYRKASAVERERAQRVLREILPISGRTQGMLNDARLSGNPPRYAIEKIHAPTLIVSVRNDLFGTYAAAQYAAEHISGARFVGYERGGHAWLGHHRDIVEQIAEFVRENAGTVLEE